MSFVVIVSISFKPDSSRLQLRCEHGVHFVGATDCEAVVPRGGAGIWGVCKGSTVPDPPAHSCSHRGSVLSLPDLFAVKHVTRGVHPGSHGAAISRQLCA